MVENNNDPSSDDKKQQRQQHHKEHERSQNSQLQQWTQKRMNVNSLSSSKPKVRRPTQSVHPSIFRYTCTGKLSLHGDAQHGQARMGTCRGISSQLELVDHWRPMSYDQAVMQFQAREATAAAPTGDSDGSHHDGHPGPAGHSSAGGPSSSAAHAVQAVHLSNVLVYPQAFPSPSSESDKKKKLVVGKQSDVSDKKASHQRSNTTTSTSTLPPHSEEWKCYGSTEVDLLVLRPQDDQDETIAGVAPYSSPGVTVRDVTSPTLGKERTTTVRLSILEILYQNTISPDDLIEDTKNHAKSKHDKSKSKKGSNSSSESSVDDDDNDNDKLTGASIFTPTKMYASGKKILHHMKLNADLLYSSVQDDFPGRTWAASERIGSEVEKTIARTYNTMKKVIVWVMDNSSPRGGGGNGGGNGGGFGGFGSS